MYGPRRDLRDAASDDVSEDSELELDDGEDGEPEDCPESEDEEEVVPLGGLDSFAADVFAFSTEEVERDNLVSLRFLRRFLGSLRSRSHVRSLGQLALDQRKTTRPPWGRP